jgi:RND superfamily putative drug exporter
MTRATARASFSDWLTSRLGARIALGVAVLFVVVLFGALGQVKGPSGNATASPGSESATVSSQLASVLMV